MVSFHYYSQSGDYFAVYSITGKHVDTGLLPFISYVLQWKKYFMSSFKGYHARKGMGFSGAHHMG